MRVLLAILLGFMATAAQAQQPAIYYHRPAIVVTEIEGDAAGERHCGVVISNLVDRLKLRWSLDGRAVALLLEDPLGLGPFDDRMTRIELLLDGEPVRPASDPARPHPIAADVYRGKLTTGELPGLPRVLATAQVIELRPADGVGRNSRFMLPSMPPLLAAVEECRRALPR
jgi:hypothetical protein